MSDPGPTRGERLILTALLFGAPIVHWLALGPKAPNGTFLLLAKLSSSSVAGDASNLVYAFAWTPAFALLGWIFESPGAFLLFGLFAHGLFNLCVFALAFVASRELRPVVIPPVWIAATLALLVFPVALAARYFHEGTTLVPHDVYYTFSFRTLASTLVALGYLGLVTRRLRMALWCMAASGYLHPTLGLLAFGLFGSAATVVAWKARNFYAVGHAFAAGTVVVAPALWKLTRTNWPADLQLQMSAGDWYSSMIKDEADDFSLIYQLLVQPETVAYYFATIGAALWLCHRLVPGAHRTLSFRLAALVPVLFVAGAGLEYLAAVVFPTPLLQPLVSLTVGYRLLSFAFFPIVVVAALILTVSVERLGPWTTSRTLAPAGTGWAVGPRAMAVGVVVLAWSALAAYGLFSGRTATALAYGRWAVTSPRVPGIDAYLLAIARAGGDEFDRPPLFRCDGDIVIYSGERSLARIRAMDRRQPRCVEDRTSLSFLNAESFAQLSDELRRRIPPGEGLYVPPYLFYFRDALPDHRIFFQEHHDGNLMMGSPRFAAFWSSRMRDLLSFDYEGLPSKVSGLSFTRLRQAYLAIDGARAADLRRRYPAFRYLLAEATHALPYDVVLTTGGFVVYDLERPMAPRAPPTSAAERPSSARRPISAASWRSATTIWPTIVGT